MTMTIDEVVYYFLVYSLFGFILENMFSFLTQGVFWKDGFLKGPLKPMYGIAPLLILILLDGERSLWVTLLLCLVVPTAVEYITGYYLYTLFGRRWWDYSKNRMQLHGHVCLQFSIFWWILSYILLEFVHPLVTQSYLNIQRTWEIAAPFFMLLLAADLIWSFWARRKEWIDGMTDY